MNIILLLYPLSICRICLYGVDHYFLEGEHGQLMLSIFHPLPPTYMLSNRQVLVRHCRRKVEINPQTKNMESRTNIWTYAILILYLQNIFPHFFQYIQAVQHL